MQPRSFLLSGLALALCAVSLRGQGVAQVQTALAQLKPTYFWTFDRTHVSAGSAGAAALQPQGGRFVADFDGKEAAAQAFETTGDGLVFPGDPITGGGQANVDADGTGSIFLFFRAFEKAPRGQRFLFAQGGKSTEAQSALALFIQSETAPADPGALVARAGNAQFVVAPSSELAPGGWHFFAMSWDEARRTEQVRWYFGPVGGEVSRSGSSNLTQRAVVGNDGPFSIGFCEVVDSSAFREPNHPGALDAFAIFDRELKPEEIKALAALLRRP